jgi:putative proteasome-type protease
MTFCIGIRVREGIVALADTRIVRGSEQSNKQKLAEFQHNGQSLFTMTSGLRSIRDKTITYLDESLRKDSSDVQRLYQVVNRFGEQLRRVKDEDGVALQSTNHKFNSHAIIGGRLIGDASPQLFYVYPEGNWIEAAQDAPYFVIGRTHYGKPILDSLLNYETPLRSAIGLALLAFDATRTSVTDVDCPIDVAVLTNQANMPTFRRYSEADIASATDWWSTQLVNALNKMPMQWANGLLNESANPPAKGTGHHDL